MNDLMSAGLHRVWKRFLSPWATSGRRKCSTSPAERATSPRVRAARGHARTRRAHRHQRRDAARGRDRLVDEGRVLPTSCCDAEALPFAPAQLRLRRDRLRPAQRDAQGPRARRDASRVEARAASLILEFCKSRAAAPRTTGTASTCCRARPARRGRCRGYRYLAESIRMHPDQATLKGMMKTAGFGHVDVHNMAGGAVALHVGIKC